MTADEDMAEKYDQDDGAQKILEHFQEKQAPGLIGMDSDFPSENVTPQKTLQRFLFPANVKPLQWGSGGQKMACPARRGYQAR
jgi:hypothetical protein